MGQLKKNQVSSVCLSGDLQGTGSWLNLRPSVKQRK